MSYLPNIIHYDPNFVSSEHSRMFQRLLINRQWVFFKDSNDDISGWSFDLYNHYKWDGNWDATEWLDSTPPEWEDLYLRISDLIPPHFLHWVDVKVTPPLCEGSPPHRDKDPWTKGGDSERFSRTISIVCNLNHEWKEEWGGAFNLWNEDGTLYKKVPLEAGALTIMDNCTHSIEPITEPNKNRISLIIHVLEYK